MTTLFSGTNVIPITDDDLIISTKPRIRSSLWRTGDEGYLLCAASWCPHCQSKVPLWTALADRINTNPNTGFIIMASDIEADSPLMAMEANITGVPTLFKIDGNGSFFKISSRSDRDESSEDTTDWSFEDLMSRVPETSQTQGRTTQRPGSQRSQSNQRNRQGSQGSQGSQRSQGSQGSQGREATQTLSQQRSQKGEASQRSQRTQASQGGQKRQKGQKDPSSRASTKGKKNSNDVDQTGGMIEGNYSYWP